MDCTSVKSWTFVVGPNITFHKAYIFHQAGQLLTQNKHHQNICSNIIGDPARPVHYFEPVYSSGSKPVQEPTYPQNNSLQTSMYTALKK